MSARVTDFRTHGATLRRIMHVLAATAVLGLAAGVACVMVEPGAVESPC
jgi:hypothetical protein